MNLAQGVSPFAAAVTAAAGAGGSAALVLAVAGEPWRGRAGTTRGWGPPLAVAAGGTLGSWLARGRPSFPPTQAVHWVFYAAVAGGVLGVLESAGPRAVRFLRVLAAGLLPVLLLEFQRARYWTRVEGVLWTAGLALLLFVAWSTLAGQEERGGCGGATAMGLALATGISAGSYVLGGGAVLGQQAGALALALGLCALFGLWRRAPGLGAAGVAPYILVHHALLWVARWVNELSTASFVLLALVPFAALAPRLVPASRTRLRTGLALCSPTLLAAAALAVELSSADTSAYG